MDARIRVLKLVNNFYRDEGVPEDFNRKEKLGDLCVLGYFDAIDITMPKDEGRIWELLCQSTVDRVSGRGCYRMLICLTNEKERDENFWHVDNRMPYYFISMIRVDRKALSYSGFCTKIEEYNERENQISYFSYDHSEVIVVTKSKTYSEGMQLVKNLREDFAALKIYTIFAAYEEMFLDIGEDKGEDEIVNFRLRCVIKKYKDAKKFKQNLVSKLSEISKGHEFMCYYTLGGNDWLIEINNVNIKKFLKFYLMGDFMTHTHKDYEAGIFNIESEVLVPQKES